MSAQSNSVRSPKGLTPPYDWHVDHDLIGKQVTYTKADDTEVKGICTGCQLAGSMIYDMETMERWAGIRFRVKPADGSRQFWTDAFADKSRPIADEHAEVSKDEAPTLAPLADDDPDWQYHERECPKDLTVRIPTYPGSEKMTTMEVCERCKPGILRTAYGSRSAATFFEDETHADASSSVPPLAGDRPAGDSTVQTP